MGWLLLGLLVILNGCVRVPDEEVRCQLMPTPALECTTEGALAENLFHQGDFPEQNWWEMFEDDQLCYLIEEALRENPSMQAACARVQAAEANARIKRSFLFPTVRFSPYIDAEYYSKNGFFRAFAPQIPGGITDYEIDLDFSYEIDFWGRNRNNFRAALGIARAMEAERQNVALMLSTSVAMIYFKLQANLQKICVLKEERAVLTKLFYLTEKREQHALDNSMQLLASEERLFEINQNILFSEQRIALLKNMLHMLIGQGPDSCDEVEKVYAIEDFSFPLPCHLSSNLLARRPDLMSYIWRVQSGAHRVASAKAEFYPRVDLFALAGLDSIFANKLFGWGSRTGFLKPAVHLPIFTAGRIRANLREKQAELDEMIYAYNEAVLKAVKEVSDEVVSLQLSSERLEVAMELVGNRESNRQLEVFRYKHAVANMLELLSAQNELLQQKFSKIKYEYYRLIAAVKLIKALGGGYCTEEVPFD